MKIKYKSGQINLLLKGMHNFFFTNMLQWSNPVIVDPVSWCWYASFGGLFLFGGGFYFRIFIIRRGCCGRLEVTIE